MKKKDPNQKKTLTPKQYRFVLAYLRTGNGTRSAEEAGYKGNESTLGAIAVENLRKPLIMAELSKMQARVDRPKIAQLEEVLETLSSELRAPGEDARHTRIKAAHLLGKRYGGYMSAIEQRRKELEIKQLEHTEAIAKLQREDAERRYGSNVPLVEEGRFYPAGGPGVGSCCRYHSALDPTLYPGSPLLALSLPGVKCPLCGGLAPVAPLAPPAPAFNEDDEEASEEL